MVGERTTRNIELRIIKMNSISFVYKAIRSLTNRVVRLIYNPANKILIYLNNGIVGNNLNSNGFLKLLVTRRGKLKIGDSFSFNSGNNHNIIGRQQKTILWVEGSLTIGNNVGMSSTAIICNHKIEIKDFVTIGGGTVIYDTDFHSLDPEVRKNKQLDRKNAKFGMVTIEENAFIGAHTTILKGVRIGKNSVIGACSVVSKDVPDNEIWSGNPIRFIRKV
jgi:acetyltransferase-like isoleucine patch superfamily enzyme